jgi:hypothetical protein
VIDGLDRIPKVRSFPTHHGRVRTLAWSPRGERLASGGRDGAVIIWDPARESELVRMQPDRGAVMGVAWSPDGKRLASCGTNLLAIIWDAETGRKLATMRGHHSWVEAVAWSPDGTRLASAGMDNSVRISNPQTGHETYVLRGQAGMFHDVSWHPDGAQVAAASSDGQIWIWDATRGYERVITDQAADGNVLVKRATAYEAAGQPDLAAADWLRAARRHFDLAPALAPAVLRRANSLLNAGVEAFESGRRADAIRGLKQARDMLRILNRAIPEDGGVASRLAISLGYLGSALRVENRPTEALDALQDARQVLEAIRRPTSLDLYNLACTYANLSTLGEFGTVPLTSAEPEALADRAMDALQRSLAAGMTDFNTMDRDHDLDSLRDRPDFRALMRDRVFPSDPFAR